MSMIDWRLVSALGAAACLCWVSAPAKSYEIRQPFEPALRVQRATLGSDRSNPGPPATLTCYWFHQVMVKEASLSGPGSTISYVPIGPTEKSPPCGKGKLPSERLFPHGGLGGSGSFVGVASGTIVLGGYPANGLDAREIYDITTGKRRFQDLVKLDT